MERIKEEMKQYWAERVPAFSAQRCREFQSPKQALWMAEFLRYLPADRLLRILDIGTGTGFFASLLTMVGHQVVGIDLTEAMITEAKRKGEQYQWNAEFHVMDAEAPAFPAASFDAIVSRNVTWTLPHLPKAYAAWHRLLKKGGVLLNFDADYCHEKPCQTLPEEHAHHTLSAECMSAYEKMKAALRQVHVRPQWDQELLQTAGFSEITVDETVWQRIYGTMDEFYNPTPIFAIAARA